MDYNPPTLHRMPLPAAYDLDECHRNVQDDDGSRVEPVPGRLSTMQEEEMAARKQTESICYNCGFQIVTDYLYVQPCPICGQQLTQRKPAAAPRGNKKEQRSKENGTD